MSGNVSVALVGLGGYGNHYLGQFFKPELPPFIKLVAAVDPNPVACEYLPQINDAKIPIFTDLDSMYKNILPDLVIIAAPIHFHRPMTCLALEKGSNVLCEKPLTATLEDARAILKAAAAAAEKGLQVAVGYQWSYAPATIKLKNDIISGRFGRCLTLKTLSLWPRRASYYARAPWAGKIKLGDNWVMDSPVTNATAHYLHNMLYLLGPGENLAAVPRQVESEIYRAKDTENYDTAMIRVTTQCDAEILFYTTHSCKHQIGPIMQFEFEDATVVSCSTAGTKYMVHFNDGTVEDYSDPNQKPEAKVVLTAQSILDRGKFRCDARAACSHMMVTNAIQKAAGEIPVFPDDIIKTYTEDDDSLVFAQGVDEIMLQCYAAGMLPSEMGGVRWALKADRADIHPKFSI